MTEWLWSTGHDGQHGVLMGRDERGMAAWEVTAPGLLPDMQQHPDLAAGVLAAMANGVEYKLRQLK